MSFGFSTAIERQGLAATITDLLAGGVQAAQVTTHGYPFNAADLATAAQLLPKFRLYSHSCITMNVACPGCSLAGRRVADILRREVEIVQALGATTVVHIGSQTTGQTKDGTLENVVAALQSLNLKPRPANATQRYPLLLENAAGEGSKLGSSREDWVRLAERTKDLPVGFCLDTAHAFGAGVFDFNTVENVDDMFDQVEEIWGPGRFQLLHLNDSKIKFGGRADRHENIGRGYIWSHSKEPCAYLLRECRRRGIDVILETPSAGQDEDYTWGLSVI